MPDGHVDHLWIRVRDPQGSRRFYTTIAPHAGLRLTHDEPDRVQLSGPDYSVSLVRDGRPPTEHVHVAFGAREDATVRAFHAAALAAGLTHHCWIVGDPVEQLKRDECPVRAVAASTRTAWRGDRATAGRARPTTG